MNRLFIIWAAKSWSTSLYSYLNQHPEICMSPIKETNYFSRMDIDPEKFNRWYKKKNELDLEKYFSQWILPKKHIAFIRKSKDYNALFRESSNEKYLWEASTSYLWSESAAKEIKEIYPDAKFIIVLRNPIDRAYSHWQMDVRAWTAENKFLQALRNDINNKNKWWWISHLYKELWLYSEQVKRYLDLFPEKQIMVLLSEDIWWKEEKIMKEIFKFLGIKNIDDLHFGIENLWWVPKYPLISKVISTLNLHGFIRDYFPQFLLNFLQKKLTKKAHKINEQEKDFCRSLYKSDIKRLETIIFRDLKDWL